MGRHHVGGPKPDGQSHDRPGAHGAGANALRRRQNKEQRRNKRGHQKQGA